MSRRRRRSRGRNGNRQQAEATRTRTRQRNDGPGFWGDRSLLPSGDIEVRMTDDPHAVPRSLGDPPLPGHREVADYYFAAIYERAVATAGALAAAGDLIRPDELTDSEV